VAIGAGSIILDIFTGGTSSIVKGGIKTGIKAGGKSLGKRVFKSPTTRFFDDEVSSAASGSNIAKYPVGRGGNPFKEVAEGISRNKATVINGRKFSGHALDQMQNKGVLSPSAVIDVIRNPTNTYPGNRPGTLVFIRDNLKIITNELGDVITVIHN